MHEWLDVQMLLVPTLTLRRQRSENVLILLDARFFPPVPTSPCSWQSHSSSLWLTSPRTRLDTPSGTWTRRPRITLTTQVRQGTFVFAFGWLRSALKSLPVQKFPKRSKKHKYDSWGKGELCDTPWHYMTLWHHCNTKNILNDWTLNWWPRACHLFWPKINSFFYCSH